MELRLSARYEGVDQRPELEARRRTQLATHSASLIEDLAERVVHLAAGRERNVVGEVIVEVEPLDFRLVSLVGDVEVPEHHLCRRHAVAGTELEVPVLPTVLTGNGGRIGSSVNHRLVVAAGNGGRGRGASCTCLRTSSCVGGCSCICLRAGPCFGRLLIQRDPVAAVHRCDGLGPEKAVDGNLATARHDALLERLDVRVCRRRPRCRRLRIAVTVLLAGVADAVLVAVGLLGVGHVLAVVARVAELVAVAVRLIVVRHLLAVVGGVRDAVAVGVDHGSRRLRVNVPGLHGESEHGCQSDQENLLHCLALLGPL